MTAKSTLIAAPRLLLVDDDEEACRLLAEVLSREAYQVTRALSAREALTLVDEEGPFDAVLTDLRMPEASGLDLLAELRKRDGEALVLVLTAFGDATGAAEAIRAGAYDFISKPYDLAELRQTLSRALERRQLVADRQSGAVPLPLATTTPSPTGGLVGHSPAIIKVMKQVERVAPSQATVLITGETGTGKELVARAIHKGSLRANETFLAVNCAAVAEQLLESELFGHEKGSFTGADRAKPGFFEAADRGTLFLDEAGEMSLGLQAKLLRVLTDGQFLRVGANVTRTVDVRVIAATHRDLNERVKSGQFREDLYYRLAVVPTEMPPLRDRTFDIPILVEFLIGQIARDLKIEQKNISEAAVEKLKKYTFPGNIRELRNILERACILAQGENITPGDIFLRSEGTTSDVDVELISGLPERINLPQVVEMMESRLIQRAIRNANGVQAEAARNLGISRSDIAYKMRKYGL